MSDLLEGVQLSDFLLIECISRGGVADVYRGRHVAGEVNYEVAVKVFRPGYAQRESFREYFMTEAEKIGQFEHPNILPFLEFGEGEGLLYSVTPYIESGTLGDLLTQVGGKFSAIQALPIIQQLCSAVQYAHARDVIHGNIKLSNVYVGADGRMLLADFGIVRGYDDSQQSLTRIGWGSAEYAAPEQSLGVLRRSSDIYSLGVLLFRLLTGQPPFRGQTPVEVLLKHVRVEAPSARSINPSISDSVDSVVQVAMRKRSDDRYASAEEFSEALKAAVTLSPVASPVAKAAPAFTRPLSQNPAFVTSGLRTFSAFTTSPTSTTPTTPTPTGPLLVPPPVEASPALSEQFASSFLPDSNALDEPVRDEAGIGSQSGVFTEGPGTGDFLQGDDDTDTRLFWSSDPVEWSPIGEEQSGSVPLTAADYLQHMPVIPEPQLEQDAPREKVALVAVEPQPAVLPLSEPEAGAKGRAKENGRRKKLLPVLVIVLLLIGLLGALLSTFLFPSQPNGTPSVQPGGTTAQAGTTAVATPGVTPKASATVKNSPVSGAPTATVAVSPTPIIKPSPSPTPVPIPQNPAMPAFACSSGAMNMDGSSSFVPAIQQLTTDYNNQCSNSVTFNYNADDSQTGLNNLERGSISIAYSDLPSSGRAGLVDYRVAALIFAVVVNTDTQVTNLTTAQMQGIYSGQVTNWSQVGGSNEPVVVVSQPAGSTMRTIFETYVLRGTAQTVAGDTSGAGVQNISGGIAYMPLVDVAGSSNGAQSIALNGVAPSVTSVASGSYPFWSIEHLYTNHAAQGLALSFVSFCLNTLSIYDYTSNGAVPYSNMSDVALRSHLQDPTI
jgi:serine/threonine protein kinase/ABC-type phosphate transport system substrate-binding protein